MITREQALKLLHQNMHNINLRKHCYAVEIAMQALARHFNEDEQLWGIAGLVHDADYELNKNNPRNHVHQVISWLKKDDYPEEIINAVFAHGYNFVPGCPEPQTKMEWSLYCCDELTGLIVAVSLVKKGKLKNVEVESVLKKFPQKAFAKGVNRQQIKLCETKLGLSLNRFIEIILVAMKARHNELGL